MVCPQENLLHLRWDRKKKKIKKSTYTIREKLRGF